MKIIIEDLRLIGCIKAGQIDWCNSCFWNKKSKECDGKKELKEIVLKIKREKSIDLPVIGHKLPPDVEIGG